MMFEKDYGEGIVAVLPLHKEAKQTGKACEELAKKYQQKYRSYDIVVENCFLKLKIKDFAKALQSTELSSFSITHPYKTIVDFSSPNIGKPFHVGHLRSTILGESLSRMLERLGGKVIRWNYLGDWGIQYGKLIEAYKKWGNPQELEKKGLKYLFELYVKAHEENLTGEEEFKKLEQGDKENLALWKKFKEISLQEYQKIYELLDIKFDVWKGESHYYQTAGEVVKEALKKGIAYEDKDGSIVIPLKDKNLPNLVISKRGERTLYATRDLACLKERCKLAEHCYYVVGSEQKTYFEQIFTASKLLEYCTSNHLEHISFGLLTLPQGKFSTRKGNVIFVEDLLETIKNKVKQTLEAKSIRAKDEDIMKVTVSTLSYSLLSQARRKDFIFDLEKFVSFEGNTAIYLLYTYRRAKKIVEGAKYQNPETIKHPISKSIIVMLHRYPFYLKKAYDNKDPYYLALYAYELSKLYNKLYQQQKFIGTEYEQEGIAITFNILEKLEEIFYILNLKVPQIM
ncbi:MAG: arginine--tRNA ligase [Candidatus Nanohaloarchaeota archaeon]|nr:arginine--tRNA ligase [Candidatus Nanohaloarchaeota archaeon]